VRIICVSEELHFDEVADEQVRAAAEHSRDYERADSGDEHHRNSRHDAGNGKRNHHPEQRGHRIAPEVRRGLDEALVYLDHHGIQREYHEREVVVDHSEHDRALRVYELQRTYAYHSEEVVDYSVVAEEGHPGVGAQQEVHPHREHYYHQHCALVVLLHAGENERNRVGEHQADDRSDYRQPYRAHEDIRVLPDVRDVVQREMAFLVGEREVRHHQQRHDDEHRHPDEVRRCENLKLLHCRSPPSARDRSRAASISS